MISISSFKMKIAFIETVIWNIAAPYLVWQQWSGWLAIALICWWLYFYWWPVCQYALELRRTRKEAAKYPSLIVSEPEANFSEESGDETLDELIDYNDDPKDNL